MEMARDIISLTFCSLPSVLAKRPVWKDIRASNPNPDSIGQRGKPTAQGLKMAKEKVKTGVPGLDDMLDGGLIPARTYVISGASGTGKTSLAMRFLIEGARRGERVMYVAIDEPPNEVKENSRSFGWDIGRIQVFDATPDIMNYDKTPVRDVSTERKVDYFADVSATIRKTSERSPVDMTISTLQEMLKLEMKTRRYARVVIDSLTSLRYFYIRTSEENTSLISFLRVLSDLGVTCLVTVQLPEIAKSDVEAHMARGEIRLHKWFDGRGLMRGITVEKYRGSGHDHRLRPLKITDEGIVIKMPVPESEEMEEVAKEAAESAAAGRPGDQKTTPLKETPAAPQPEIPPTSKPIETPGPPKDDSGPGGPVQ
jgi:KaiC/GvpD/RAD55 family RecA-like ATPase